MIEKTVANVFFVQDLNKCTKFYKDIFKLNYKGSDESSSYFTIGDDLFLILLSPAGKEELIGGQEVQTQTQGLPRGVLAARVKDVDSAYNDLKVNGVEFIKPPMDRKWGMRTAHFADPEGNIWEINSVIEEKKKESAKKTD